MSRKFDYGRYLASREWALLKERVRKRCNDRCERCGGKYEETHHLTYTRIGHERLDDLLAVCSDCHDFLSAKSDRDPAESARPISTSKPCVAPSEDCLITLMLRDPAGARAAVESLDDDTIACLGTGAIFVAARKLYRFGRSMEHLGNLLPDADRKLLNFIALHPPNTGTVTPEDCATDLRSIPLRKRLAEIMRAERAWDAKVGGKLLEEKLRLRRLLADWPTVVNF